jgi:predicted HNH restriction endonuclease
MKGIMMLADSDWLAYHQRHSAGKIVIFYGSPDRKTSGYAVLFCVQHLTRKLIAVGKIQKQVLVHQDKAWAEYSSALGANTEIEWRQQAASVLENSQNNYDGQILAIELSDFHFFPEPVSPELVGIENTGWQKMKKVEPEVTASLMKIFQDNSEPDIALALEFGLDPNEKTFKEGKEQMRLHLVKERNQNLVKQAKAQWLQDTNGKLHCGVCGFSFLEKYGKHGAGFIEAHHGVPIASLTVETTVTIADLASVCSNCHRMIHRYQPLLTTQQLKQIIQNL